MKKGLLSILAGALVVVGCQNYDDQFDNLESQISALASTVAGLSQVQSDLASLAGTVSSLSSTVNGLGSAIDTAVSDGLADIQADIEAIETAVADVASSEEVSALSDAVAASQEDLDELLANSSVFTGDVTVNSVATLDAFHAMGSSLAIVNGNVDIDVDTEMDMVKVQELVNQFLTITKDLSYTAEASTIEEVTFDNLTGVQTLTLEQPGGYVLAKLESAQKISLSDKYEGSIDIIDFRSLKSVASFGTDSYTNNTIDFGKATEIHLTAIPYVTGTTSSAPLTVKGKKGGVIDITALRDVNAAGDQAALHLSINGPASLTIADLDGENGSIVVEDVASATINSYDGAITVKGGVETLSSDNVVDITFTNADDLVEISLTGVVDPNYTATTEAPKDYGPVINLEGRNDLESATFAGTFTSIELDSNTNLVTAIISADVTGGDGININGNTDLETLTLTGSKAPQVVIDDNDSLLSLTINTTIQASSAKLATKDGTVKVIGNSDLTSLVIESTDVSSLWIYDNDDLTSIDGTKLITLGAGGTTASPVEPSIKIYDNDLTASLAQDKENATGCTKCADLEANDLGTFTTTSKIETLKTYLALVAADTKATADVYFDTVASTVDKDGTETTAETLWASDATDATLAKVVILKKVVGADAVYTGNNALVKEKRAWLLDAEASGDSANGIGIDLTVDGVSVLHNGTDYGIVTLTNNTAIDLAAIKSALATTRATTLGVSFDAYAKGNSTAPKIDFLSSVSSASNGEYYTNAAVAAFTDGTVSSSLTSYDVFTITVGGLAAKATLTYAEASGVNNSRTNNNKGSVGALLAKKLADNWNAKWITASPNFTVWTALDADTNSGTIAANSLATSNSGSKGWNDLISIAWSKASAANASIASSGAVTNTIMDWTIGSVADSSDNNAEGHQIILQLTEGTNRIDKATGQATLTFTGTTGSASSTSVELLSALRTYTDAAGTSAVAGGTSTITTNDKQPEQATADVTFREVANEGTIKTPAVTAVNQSRVHWLAGS